MFVERTVGRVPRSFGDNRGAWPSRIRTTAADPRKRVPAGDYDDPLHGHHLVYCYWCRNEAQARCLVEETTRVMTDYGSRLRHAWNDIPPPKMDEIVRWAATVGQIEIWSDAECFAAVQAALQEEIAEAVGGLGQ